MAEECNASPQFACPLCAVEGPELAATATHHHKDDSSLPPTFLILNHETVALGGGPQR